MAIEAINRIKAAESSAADKLRIAREEAKKIAFEANLRAEALVKDAQEKAKLQAHQLLGESALSAEKETHKMFAQASEAAGRIRESASGKMRQAVEFIVDRVKSQWR